jgi:hypothetical protein
VSPKRRLGVQAVIFARRRNRPDKNEYGVRLGEVGVWTTPDLGFADQIGACFGL